MKTVCGIVRHSKEQLAYCFNQRKKHNLNFVVGSSEDFVKVVDIHEGCRSDVGNFDDSKLLGRHDYPIVTIG